MAGERRLRGKNARSGRVPVRLVGLLILGIFIVGYCGFHLITDDVTCGRQSMAAGDRCVTTADGDGESLVTEDDLAQLPQRPVDLDDFAPDPALDDVYAQIRSVPTSMGRSRDEQAAHNDQNMWVATGVGAIATIGAATGLLIIHARRS
ncbi:hypothetical protein AAFP35_04500 [Gordonia sp. CPCC 206044]|uniref:hypothetical protein n=1 Tax=Gordonia sp. CPCC 206044 TaxID=3140793 RepID=UPI003AF34F41